MAKKTLKQLREQYPDIKARSIDAFLTKLKEAEGLGDTIEAITEATGIKKAVEWLANGKDCGCAERKVKLNKMFRYKPECMVQSEYEWWTLFLKRYDMYLKHTKVIPKTDIYELHRLYRRLFRINLRICTNCPSAKNVIENAVKEINLIYDTYSK
jgi:hypothetical protein